MCIGNVSILFSLCDADGNVLNFLHSNPVGMALMEIRNLCIREWQVEDVEVQLLAETGEMTGNVPSSAAFRLGKHLRITDHNNGVEFFVPTECNVPEVSEFQIAPCRFFVNRPVVCKFAIPTLPGSTTPSNKTRLRFASKFSVFWERSSTDSANFHGQCQHWVPMSCQHLNICVPSDKDVGGTLRCCIMFEDISTPLAVCTFDNTQIESEPCEFWKRTYLPIEDIPEIMRQRRESGEMLEASDETSGTCTSSRSESINESSDVPVNMSLKKSSDLPSGKLANTVSERNAEKSNRESDIEFSTNNLDSVNDASLGKKVGNVIASANLKKNATDICALSPAEARRSTTDGGDAHRDEKNESKNSKGSVRSDKSSKKSSQRGSDKSKEAVPYITPETLADLSAVLKSDSMSGFVHIPSVVCIKICK